MIHIGIEHYCLLLLVLQQATAFSMSSCKALTLPRQHRSSLASLNAGADIVEELELETASSSSDIALLSSTPLVLSNNNTDLIMASSPVNVPMNAGTLAPPDDWISLWKRRLITQEDPLSIHKIASMVYTVTGFGILVTAAVRQSMGPETFSHIPEQLLLPTYAFSISNLIMCVASVRMAFLHRRYDLTARNAFLGTAASSLFSGFYFLWTSPLGPDIFNNQLVTQACFGVFVLLNVIFIMDTCFKIPEVVEGRRDRKAKDYQGRYWMDAFGYVFPVAWALPFVLVTGYVDAILFDREWFFQQCLLIDQKTGVPGIQANLNYLQVLTSLAPSYGALFVTLRDKKLISKNQELAGITIFSMATLIWTIYGTSIFFANMSWSR